MKRKDEVNKSIKKLFCISVPLIILAIQVTYADVVPNNDISSNANIVYLLDQFYNNAWSKLIWVIGIAFAVTSTFVGLVINIKFSGLEKQIESRDKKIVDLSGVVEGYEKSISDIEIKIMDLTDEFASRNDQWESEKSELATKFMEKFESLSKEIDLPETFNESILNDIKNTEIKRSVMKLKFNNQLISGTTVKDFYKKVFTYIFENTDPRIVNDQEYMPFHTGSKRFLISKDKVHPNEKPFFAPIQVEGYWIETHKSKSGAMSDIRKYLDELGVLNYEVVE